MGRKAYIADLAEAAASAIPGITSVIKGPEDGDVHVCFVPLSGIPIEMSLLSLGNFPSWTLLPILRQFSHGDFPYSELFNNAYNV